MSGLAAGVNDTFRQGGIAVGVAALGTLIPSASVHLHDAAYVDGMRTALIVGAAVCAVGAIAGSAPHRRPRVGRHGRRGA